MIHLARWRRNAVQFAAAAAITFLLVRCSDLAFVAHADLLLGLRGPSAETNGPPRRPWAYVPTGGSDRARQMSFDNGELASDDDLYNPRLENNDLYRLAREARARLNIQVYGLYHDDVASASLRSLVVPTGGELRWTGEGSASVFTDEGLVRFTSGQKRGERNYVEMDLPHAPFLVDDELWVSLASFAKVCGHELSGDPASGVYILSKGGHEVRALMGDEAFGIEISRSGRWVQVHYAGAPLKRYRACTGEGGNTPVGEFRIQNKAAWAAWRAYWGEYMPGGSRRNPLGARWLGTTARGRETGRAIGIHGTNQPSSIGRRISGGCIRVLNSNIIEMYEVIPVGTPVRIHE